MRTIEHDGVEYLEKSGVDELIRGRIAKVSERARFAESRVKELEVEVEGSRGAAQKLEALTTTVEGLQAELKIAGEKYSIHSAIASQGFTDSDTRDMIEWSWRRAMEGKGAKEKVELGEWLEALRASPEEAPGHLRPLLVSQPPSSSQGVEEPQGPSPENTQGSPQAPPPPPSPQPPTSNAGVQASRATGEDLITAALANSDMWRESNDAIKEAWYNQSGQTAPFRW